MDFQTLQNQPNYYKVLETNRTISNKEMLGGGIYEKDESGSSSDYVALWDKEKKESWIFFKCEVQLMTPVKFNGELIGIGDWVKDVEGDWLEVYDYVWDSGEFKLYGALVDKGANIIGYKHDCVDIKQEDIRDHQPLFKQDSAEEEAIKLLKKNGYKIIKE